MLYLRNEPGSITFKVRIQPRAKKNTVVGLMGDALKIKITAPPVDGAANVMCIKFLADLLNLPQSALEIITGKTGREKIIQARVLNQEETSLTIARLEALIAST